MNDHINLVRIKSVYNLLRPLERDFVFVGGAVVSLYADTIAEEVRPTDDVDVLLEIYTMYAYAEMEERLRSLGFKNDVTARFVGRYLYDGLVVDFMPMSENVLGFSNRWYEDGYNNATTIALDERTTVKIFTAPYFLASKIEAFKSRGKNEQEEYDGRTSTDFEDLIFVLQNRRSIWDEINSVDEKLKSYYIDAFSWLLDHPNFEEWVNAHVGFNSSAAGDLIIPGLQTFLNKNQPSGS